MSYPNYQYQNGYPAGMPPMSQPAYEKALRKEAERKELRKTSNRVGLAVMISTLAFIFLSIILAIIYMVLTYNATIPSGIDSIPDNILNSIISISVFGVVGIIFLFAGKLGFAKTLPFDRISFKRLLLFAGIGFSVCMLSNYLTELFLTNASGIGIDLNIDYNSPESDSFIEIIVYFISVAVVPAFSEEFLFRGVILSQLRKFGDVFAILASALFFGLIHGNFTQIPFAFIVGLVLGYVTVKTNSILPGMLIHFANNGFSVILDIVYTNCDSWHLNETAIDIFTTLFVVAVFAVTLVAVCILSRRDPCLFKLNKYEGELDTKTRNKTFFTSPTVIIATVIILLESISTHMLV